MTIAAAVATVAIAVASMTIAAIVGSSMTIVATAAIPTTTVATASIDRIASIAATIAPAGIGRASRVTRTAIGSRSPVCGNPPIS